MHARFGTGEKKEIISNSYLSSLKIEEFETHQPRVKVHEIVTHNHGKAAAIMGIQQFDATEKRLVRLENNMATVLRYLYRLGSRVFINCQYYGQNKIPKY